MRSLFLALRGGLPKSSGEAKSVNRRCLSRSCPSSPFSARHRCFHRSSNLILFFEKSTWSSQSSSGTPSEKVIRVEGHDQATPATSTPSSSPPFPVHSPSFRDVDSKWLLDEENHRKYMDWFGEFLGFKSRQDWYKITRTDFLNNYGGKTLLDYYGSPFDAVRKIYSDFEYLPWLFEQSPKSFFEEKQNRVDYINWLMKKVGAISEIDLQGSDFKENGGQKLLSMFHGSPLLVINSTKDESDNKVVSLNRKPHGFWKSYADQKAFFDEVGKRIGVRDGDLSAWYHISREELISLVGMGALNKYSSIYNILSAIYPNFPWDPSKFERIPRRASEDAKWMNDFIADVEAKLEIISPEDWYRVSRQKIKSMGLEYILIKKHGSLFETLKKYRPNFSWEEEKFMSSKRKSITN